MKINLFPRYWWGAAIAAAGATAAFAYTDAVPSWASYAAGIIGAWISRSIEHPEET